jgi:ABC-type transport system substrate-binding protein
VLQTRRPPLDDKRIRRALAFALDRPSLVAKISGGFASPATADLGPDVWAYDATVRPLPFDPARSRAILAEAGWKPDAIGMLERDGKPISLLLVYAAGSDAAALQIQAMFRIVGVNVELKPQQPNIFYAPAAEHGTEQSGAFDLALDRSVNTADPNDRLVFACASIPPNGFNVSRWCNAEYDRVTDHALLHVDRPTRKRDYKRAAQILVDEAPEIFLSWFKEIELLRRGVHIDDGADHLALPYLWSKDGSSESLGSPPMY